MLQSDIKSIETSKRLYFDAWTQAKEGLQSDTLTLEQRNQLCNMQIECERMIQGYNSVLIELQVNAR